MKINVRRGLAPALYVRSADNDTKQLTERKPIENDVDPKWDQYPDMYVDLNRPVVPSNASKDADNPVRLKERLIYPIADP